MWARKRIAVVVPARNEARLIRRMLARVPSFVDCVVVVDDGSTDGTFRLVQALADPRVTLVRHSGNRGVGAAIVTGMYHALEAQADLVAVMAGDDQMDPADLPALIEPVVSGRADYAKGNRLIHAEKRRMPLGRRVAGMALATVTSLTTGLRIGDSQCGYAALSAAAAKELPLDDLWPRYGYPNDLLGLLAERSMRVVEVPVRPIYADESSGVRPWHALTVLGVVVRRLFLARLRDRTQEVARATMASAHFKV